MDKVTHKVRCERWTRIINERLASGMKKPPGAERMAFPTKYFFTGSAGCVGNIQKIV